MAIQTPAGCLATNATVCLVFSAVFGCRFPGVLRCGSDTLCAACPCRLCVLLFYLLFLPEAGKGIARKLRVIVQRLVVLEVDIRLCRRSSLPLPLSGRA